MVLRGMRGGYHTRGGSTRGTGRSSYHGGSGYHSNHNSSSYDNRNDTRNSRYSSSGGGGGYDSRNSRYDSDSRYSRHDSRNDGYKRSNSSKYEDNRDRRSPDRKRPRSEHNTQGGSSRRDYSSSSTSGVGGRGASSSSRYHEGGSSSSSYDKRGSNDHHSSTSTGGDGGSSSSRNKFDHHRSSSSASRSHGGGGDSGSSYRSRDNHSSSMGPPRSVAMRTNNTSTGRSMMRPPMGGSNRPLGMGGSSYMGGGGLHRRGTTMRGRISHYRSDGRRGMLPSRMIGAHHRRTDMRPMTMHNRRFPSIRGRGDIRSRIMSGGSDMGSKRSMDSTVKISKKTLIKRALQAAKDGYEESPSDNEDDDDEDDDGDDVDAEPSRAKKAKKTDASLADDDDHIKKEKEEMWDDDDDDEDVKPKSTRNDDDRDDDDDDANTTGATADEGDVEKEDVKVQSVIKKKVIKKEDAKDKSEDRKTSDENDQKRSTKINTKYRTSTFIKLTCVHCKLKCVTFKEYQMHLYDHSHKKRMRQLAIKCRERLLEMRAAQRNAQKDEDEKSEEAAGGEDGKQTQRAAFCMLCRLNYRQPRAIHQQSEGHKQMKKFLMPFCSVCNIGFKSPMAYETHRASLDHLKIKARVERYASSTKGDDSGEDTPADAGDLVDMDNLTIVDEVGKVDEICESAVGGDGSFKKRTYWDGARAGTEDDDDEDDDDDDDDDETQMIIGEEHVKKVQVQYCDLCNMYLPRRSDIQEKMLRDHCKKRSHLKLYIRFRNDKKLREQAERIHKKKLKGDKEAASGKKGDDKKTTDAGNSTGGSAETKTSDIPGGGSTKSGTGGEAGNTEKKFDGSTGAESKSSTGANSAGAGTALHDADSSEANLSLDGSSNLASISGPDGSGALTDDVDKLMWQVVDNDDLGDLLRDVQDDVEEEDDDKTNLERYDKFRHTEKNGLEQRSDAAGGDGGEEDCGTGKTISSQGKKATSANGGETAANGDTGKETKSVVG